MLDAANSTAFKDIEKSNEVARDVRMRFLNGVPHARLGAEVNHPIKTPAFEKTAHPIAIGKVDGFKREPGIETQSIAPSLFQSNVVVGIEVVESGNLNALLQQPAGDVIADESRRSGYQHATQ